MEGKEKPPCQFGAKCYRKNPNHFKNFSHSEKFHETGEVKNKVEDKPETKPQKGMRQTLLNFPKICDFSGPPKAKPGKNDEKNEEKQPKKFQKSPVKKRKKPASEMVTHDITEKKKLKPTNCFRTNYSVVSESSEENSNDSETAQSTSWVFVKNTPVEETTPEIKDLKNKTTEEIIKILFLVDMPPDFYSFYEFCKSVNEKCPEKSLEQCELKLVGPFDVLSGTMKNDPEVSLCHWRFFYDPPEFQTILASESEFHIGYWRDDPEEAPVFLASNNSAKDCTFNILAENIFGALHHYLNEFTKTCDPFKKVKVTKLQTAVDDWAKKNEFSLEKKTKAMSARQKKVVSKTFHTAGIVVPVEAKTELGYRPLIETEANLKRMCKLIMDAIDEGEREALWENLQPLINAANIANDECDFGNSLELGIDLFCMGSDVFHETVEHLLSTAYSLLNRNAFEKIIKTHLKFRRKGKELSICHLKS